MAKKHVLFVCATGIATSTVVAEKVAQYCKEKGLDIEYHQSNVASVPKNCNGINLIISTTNIPYKLDIPVIRGLNLLTGIGEEDTLKKIYDILVE
ncbi:PTS sugar transporter subunit IIB [Pectinatus sottacetonis]|uniref:PTS sugar transporter subunit IIB n=1 Tax=Pectinatus sottacetonis TaxID=1002795 RepID=UPI0018C4C05F|nr:PTS sugar transporter subunit IIB [Pectinatus sottacetonis]